MGNPFGLE